jgi:hypothetical protein
MAIIIDFNTYKSNRTLVPTVSLDYIIKHNCSYIANDYLNDPYVYYWEGDLKTGRQVKVKSIDILKDQYLKLLSEILQNTNNTEDK